MGMGKRNTWSRGLTVLLVVMLIAACETSPDHQFMSDRLFTYGTRGIEIQAERFVKDVYGLPSDPLPYGNADIYYAVDGIKARWPVLKPLLDDGTVGLTEDGDVTVHDAGSRSGDDLKKLRVLVKAENRDRFFLYRGMTNAAGYPPDTAAHMIDYTEETFAKAWRLYAPKGYWLQDSRGHWTQK